MLRLSLDLSSPLASIALHQDDALLAERALGDQFQHTERLLVVLNEMLAEQRTPFAAIGRYLTVAGPGSFTGLRIAMASLKAFAMVSNCPIDTFNGAEIRALARKAPLGTSLRVLTFVSSGKFVCSRFEVGKDGVKAISEEVLGELSAGLNEIVLSDGRVPTEMIRGGQPEIFTLRARHLAEGAGLAQSRRTHASLAEWIAMTPAYFGAQHYE